MCLTIHTFTPCKIGEGRYRPEETTHGSYQLSLIYIKKNIYPTPFSYTVLCPNCQFWNVCKLNQIFKADGLPA